MTHKFIFKFKEIVSTKRCLSSNILPSRFFSYPRQFFQNIGDSCITCLTIVLQIGPGSGMRPSPPPFPGDKIAGMINERMGENKTDNSIQRQLFKTTRPTACPRATSSDKLQRRGFCVPFHNCVIVTNANLTFSFPCNVLSRLHRQHTLGILGCCIQDFYRHHTNLEPFSQSSAR